VRGGGARGVLHPLWALFFFNLKRLKTYLRNMMGWLRLNGLELMNIQRDIPLSKKQIIDEFGVKARRMNFRQD
jgi:hypothetical protein